MMLDTFGAGRRDMSRRFRRAAAAAAALALLLVAGAARAQETPVLGDVGRVVGEVTVLRGTDRLPAAPGTVLHEGDGIATGPEARVEILCADGSSITVGPDSTVSVAAYAPAEGGAARALLDLVQGILRVTLSGRTPWQSYEVRSATAVASVRSTDWIVDATRAKTGVFVVDGEVAVTSRAGAGEVLLAPGQGTDVPVGGLPSAPKAWGQARIDGVLARTSLP